MPVGHGCNQLKAQSHDATASTPRNPEPGPLEFGEKTAAHDPAARSAEQWALLDEGIAPEMEPEHGRLLLESDQCSEDRGLSKRGAVLLLRDLVAQQPNRLHEFRTAL